MNLKKEKISFDDVEYAFGRQFPIYDGFINKQKEAVLEILNGDTDVFLNMGPKSGKSVAFQLPVLVNEKSNQLAVVLSPLISLIVNHLNILSSQNIEAVTINSTTPYHERDIIKGELEEHTSDIKLFYITPEMAEERPYLIQDLVARNKVSYFVIDEAQLIFQNDHSHRTSFGSLINIRNAFPYIKWVVASTYIAPDAVAQISKVFGLRKPKKIEHKPDVESLFSGVNFYHDNKFNYLEKMVEILKYYMASSDESKVFEKYMDLSLSGKPTQNINSGIIYCHQKDTTKTLAKALEYFFPSKIGYYNGDTEEKETILDDWFNAKIPIIIVTRSSFGLGIDNPNVNFIIHFDIPPSPLDYFIQCARINKEHTSGKEKRCYLLHNAEDFSALNFIHSNSLDYKNLNWMKEYCNDSIKANVLFNGYMERPFFY